jgi:hypothetical protein
MASVWASTRRKVKDSWGLDTSQEDAEMAVHPPPSPEATEVFRREATERNSNFRMVWWTATAVGLALAVLILLLSEEDLSKPAGVAFGCAMAVATVSAFRAVMGLGDRCVFCGSLAAVNEVSQVQVASTLVQRNEVEKTTHKDAEGNVIGTTERPIVATYERGSYVAAGVCRYCHQVQFEAKTVETRIR